MLATGARGRVPGSGPPVILYGCMQYDHAEDLALAFVRGTVRAMPTQFIAPSCTRLTPFSPASLERGHFVFGPLRDFEKDTFAVYARWSNGDPNFHLYYLLWWGPGYSPIGMKI